MPTKLVAHPLAEIFPAMSDSEFADLVSDIKANGLEESIVLFDGMILDGIHRYKACLELGIVPETKEYEGINPKAYVLSHNFTRRHLTTSAKAIIAGSLENCPWGRSEKKDGNLHLTRTKAAEIFRISPRSIATASKIIDASPKLAKQVLNGEISLNAAEKKIDAKKQKEPHNSERKDITGRPIPTKILESWEAAENEGQMVLSALSKLRCAFRDAQQTNNPMYRETTLNNCIGKIDDVYGSMKSITPHAVCYVCQGRIFDKCTACKGRGYVCKYFWDICVPIEFKAMFKNETS